MVIPSRFQPCLWAKKRMYPSGSSRKPSRVNRLRLLSLVSFVARVGAVCRVVEEQVPLSGVLLEWAGSEGVRTRGGGGRVEVATVTTRSKDSHLGFDSAKPTGACSSRRKPPRGP